MSAIISGQLPPSLDDFVPEDHPARIVRELVEEALDLSSIMRSYSDARGQPPYNPRMMAALLFYAYSRGIYSSREIARCCQDRMDFMAVTACQRPAAARGSLPGGDGTAAQAGRPVPVAQDHRRAGVRTDQATRRFRQFLMRGVENARQEWTLVCIAHNLNKLVSAWPAGA